MCAVLWTRATLAGLALLGFAASSAVLAQVQPSSQPSARASLQADGKPNLQAQYDVVLGQLRSANVQSCEGDLARLRYPYEAGFQRARNAAKSDAQAAPTDARRQALLQAIEKLPVKLVRPGGARDSAPDETRAATARQAARATLIPAISILEKLVEADPEQVAWQRDLAVAYARLAAMSGAWTTDRDLQQKAVDLQKSVVAKDPANKAWQHELAQMYQGLGSVQFGMGGEKAARAAKMAELDIREKLAEDAPSNNALQSELALNYDRLCEMFHTIGNVSQARDAYQAGFEVHEKLVQREPANVEWQRDLASNLEAAGAFEGNRGKHEVGAALLQEALRLRTAMLERDPRNIGAQMDLRRSYLVIAEYYRNGGKTEAAIALYRSALQHMQRLAAANLADPGWLYYQLEFQFNLGYLVQDEIRPRLGTRVAPPREQAERVNAQTKDIFQTMLTTSRGLVAVSAGPETIRIYETAQAPRPCTIAL